VASPSPRKECCDAVRADARRTHHGAEIAILQAGRARINQQELPDVFADLAPLDDAERWQPDPFMKDLGSLGVDGPRRAASDIRLMTTVTGESHKLTFGEGGLGYHPVGQVISIGNVRVIGEEDVAVMDVVAEGFDERPHRESAVAALDRYAVGLTDQRAFCVGDEIGEVVILAEDRAVRRAQHDLSHAPRDVVETVLGQRENDGVDGHRKPPVAPRLTAIVSDSKLAIRITIRPTASVTALTQSGAA